MRREICWAAVSVFVCRWCCWVVRIRLVEQLEPALTNQLTGATLLHRPTPDVPRPLLGASVCPLGTTDAFFYIERVP